MPSIYAYSVESTSYDWMPSNYEPGSLSVIIPTYNRALVITHSLQSIYKQTYRPIEIIIVDDGSSDATASTVFAWAQAHADAELRVRYIPQQNSGAPAARNRALVASRGEFIQFLDSDDFLAPHKFERLVPELRHSNADYVYGITYRVAKNGRVIPFRGEPFDPNDPCFLTRSSWHTIGPVYRRALCRALGPWNEQLAGGQDYDYSVRVKVSGAIGKYIPEVFDYAARYDGPTVSDQRSPRFVESQIAATQCAAHTLSESRAPKQAHNHLGRRFLGLAVECDKLRLTPLRDQALTSATQESRGLQRLSIYLLRTSSNLVPLRYSFKTSRSIKSAYRHLNRFRYALTSKIHPSSPSA